MYQRCYIRGNYKLNAKAHPNYLRIGSLLCSRHYDQRFFKMLFKQKSKRTQGT
jgi:hypothetical protein